MWPSHVCGLGVPLPPSFAPGLWGCHGHHTLGHTFVSLLVLRMGTDDALSASPSCIGICPSRCPARAVSGVFFPPAEASAVGGPVTFHVSRVMIEGVQVTGTGSSYFSEDVRLSRGCCVTVCLARSGRGLSADTLSCFLPASRAVPLQVVLEVSARK